MNTIRTMAVALLLVVCAAGLHATVALKLDVATLTTKSELIVIGKVDSATAKWDAAKTGIWTHHDITVSETLKGTHEKTRDVVTRGGVVGGVGQAVAGSGNLEIGTEYVFFLWKDDDGRYRLQGMAQGAFEISEREGVKYAENSLSGMTIVDADTLKPSRDKTATLPLELTLADLKKQVADLQKPAEKEGE
ncbi:MAG: hypothetical protein H6839_05875 [Planctomycetes bacterium]|nr:hypothetical protein [Planctomycetota bacterium]